MKSKYFKFLLLPVLLLILAGALNLYWYSQFNARIPAQMANLAKVQSDIRSLDCPALNKDAILLIAQGNFGAGENLAEILFYEGVVFMLIGIIAFASIFKYLQK